jgi:hypothetical protein
MPGQRHPHRRPRTNGLATRAGLRYNTCATIKDSRGWNLKNLQVARLLLTNPTQAFAEIKAKPVFALPMWLTLIGTIAVIAWYYSKVDIAWLQDQMAVAARMPAAQQGQMAARMTRSALLWVSVITAPVAIMVITLIGALYFMLAGAITNVRYSFKHWFAFNWWAGSPQIVAFIPSLLILALSRTTQMPQSSLQPLSLNELIFHRTLGTPGYSLLSSLGLVQVAVVWLSYIGLRAWSGRSPQLCTIVAMLPIVLAYGVWALFAFR